jgi:riboflavin kinase
LIVRGRVTVGLGVGGKYVSHPYYREAFSKVLGCTPFPGTLNLATDSDWRLLASLCQPMVIEETVWNGTRLGAVYMWRVLSLGPLKGDRQPRALLIRPLLSKHPSNVLEVVACVELRPLLASDEVSVAIECRRNPLYTRAPRLP